MALTCGFRPPGTCGKARRQPLSLLHYRKLATSLPHPGCIPFRPSSALRYFITVCRVTAAPCVTAFSKSHCCRLLTVQDGLCPISTPKRVIASVNQVTVYSWLLVLLQGHSD